MLGSIRLRVFMAPEWSVNADSRAAYSLVGVIGGLCGGLRLDGDAHAQAIDVVRQLIFIAKGSAAAR